MLSCLNPAKGIRFNSVFPHESCIGSLVFFSEFRSLPLPWGEGKGEGEANANL